MGRRNKHKKKLTQLNEKDLRNASPKQLEAIASMLTGMKAEVELGQKGRAPGIHKSKTTGGNKLSKSRKEG